MVLKLVAMQYCKAFQPQCHLKFMSQAGTVLGAGEAAVNITYPNPK